MSFIARKDRFGRFVGFGVGQCLLFRQERTYEETVLNEQPVIFCKICTGYRFDKNKGAKAYQLLTLWEYADRPFAQSMKTLNRYDTINFQGVVEKYPEITEIVNCHSRWGQIHVEWFQVFKGDGINKTIEVMAQQAEEEKKKASLEEMKSEEIKLEEEEYGF